VIQARFSPCWSRLISLHVPINQQQGRSAYSPGLAQDLPLCLFKVMVDVRFMAYIGSRDGAPGDLRRVGPNYRFLILTPACCRFIQHTCTAIVTGQDKCGYRHTYIARVAIMTILNHCYRPRLHLFSISPNLIPANLNCRIRLSG
jgi:hypothetical protein